MTIIVIVKSCNLMIIVISIIYYISIVYSYYHSNYRYYHYLYHYSLIILIFVVVFVSAITSTVRVFSCSFLLQVWFTQRVLGKMHIPSSLYSTLRQYVEQELAAQKGGAEEKGNNTSFLLRCMVMHMHRT